MKIVIDIPEHIYDAIKKAQEMVSGQRSGKTLLQILVNGIENGTPLSVLLADIRGELWMEGMNMTGEYQGVWVRHKDIERVIDKYF